MDDIMYFGEVFYYMGSDFQVHASFLTPDMMLGDCPLFNTKEACIDYWRREIAERQQMEGAA